MVFVNLYLFRLLSVEFFHALLAFSYHNLTHKLKASLHSLVSVFFSFTLILRSQAHCVICPLISFSFSSHYLLTFHSQ